MKSFNFSTSTCDAVDKYESWRNALRGAFGPFEVERHDHGTFAGLIKTRARDQLQFNETFYSGESIQRRREDIARIGCEYFTLSRIMSGAAFVEHSRGPTIMNAGS